MRYNQENFHFPFDSSWNTLGMYERRKIEDTPITDPALRPQLFDNPLYTIPGLGDTNYPYDNPTIVYPGDPRYPWPNNPGGPPFPIWPDNPGDPGGPDFPILPNLPQPGYPGYNPYPKPNYPTNPLIPGGSPTGTIDWYHPPLRYDSEQIPIPRYNQYWPRMGTENTLPIPSIETSVTDLDPTMLF